MGSVQKELDKLQSLLADYSIESTPQAELCILLTTGRASAALQQFLASHLGTVLLLPCLLYGCQKASIHEQRTYDGLHTCGIAARSCQK